MSSQFDRRLFRSRVHSIETETRCIIYRLFFVLLATAKLNIVKRIWFVSIETTLDRNNLRTDHDSHSNKQEYSIDPKLCNIATYDRVIALVKNIIFSTLDSEISRPLYLHLFEHQSRGLPPPCWPLKSRAPFWERCIMGDSTNSQGPDLGDQRFSA